MFRTPERREHPANAGRLLVARHRAPDAGRLVILILVAEQRRSVIGRAMIVAAHRARVEQPETALLARLHDEFASLVLEHRAGHLQIEIALQQEFGVWRAV